MCAEFNPWDEVPMPMHKKLRKEKEASSCMLGAKLKANILKTTSQDTPVWQKRSIEAGLRRLISRPEICCKRLPRDRLNKENAQDKPFYVPNNGKSAMLDQKNIGNQSTSFEILPDSATPSEENMDKDCENDYLGRRIKPSNTTDSFDVFIPEDVEKLTVLRPQQVFKNDKQPFRKIGSLLGSSTNLTFADYHSDGAPILPPYCCDESLLILQEDNYLSRIENTAPSNLLSENHAFNSPPVEVCEEHPLSSSTRICPSLPVAISTKQADVSFSRLPKGGQMKPSSHKTGNYLKLNITKKCFSRGGTSRQSRLRSILKREKYGKMFSKFSKSHNNYGGSKFSKNVTKKGVCFRCKREGHWANKCPLTIGEKATATASDQEVMDPDFTPAEWKLADIEQLNRQFEHASLEELMQTNLNPPIPPLIGSQGTANPQQISSSIDDCLSQLGIKSLRPGQEQAIWRIIAGRSTLLVLPTAGGKSLSYQLPAYLYNKFHPPATALVVSPLISLMQDQILNLNSPIRGAYLSSVQTKEAKDEIIADACRGQYAYLLVSPEALVESEWMFQHDRLPPISFVCIDEAHCLADWSHHFRPSYLRVCRLLKTRLGVDRFLGLTATCTSNTILSVCTNLGISDAHRLDVSIPLSKISINAYSKLPEVLTADGYIQPVFNPLPSNLLITASMDENRDDALLRLLQRPPFCMQVSILIYATSRDTTERLAVFIRTALQDKTDKIGRRAIGWTTSVYHAGLSSTERSRAQKRFMSGRVRVLVATTAFGMGLNKRNLQAVIHYSLPKSFENYVQEIGRVGRNGQASFCHVFLPPGMSSDPREANDVRRHIFANHIDAVMLKRLLKLIFKPCAGACSNKPEIDSETGWCTGHVTALDPEKIAESLDIKAESLATILSYLDLQEGHRTLTILSSAPKVVTVNCYGGPNELARLSNNCLAVSAWLGILRTTKANFSAMLSSLREVSIDLVHLCNNWGWRPDTVQRELRNFQWHTSDSSGACPRRTGVTVSGSTRETCRMHSWVWIHPPLPCTPERLDAIFSFLKSRLDAVEVCGLASIEELQRAVSAVAVGSVDAINFSDAETNARSVKFHALVEKHFVRSEFSTNKKARDDPNRWPFPISEPKAQTVRNAVNQFLRVHGSSLQDQLTGRVIANIFHGIGSPQFPALAWSRTHGFWRAYLDVDWPTLKRIATDVLVDWALT